MIMSKSGASPENFLLQIWGDPGEGLAHLVVVNSRLFLVPFHPGKYGKCFQKSFWIYQGTFPNSNIQHSFSYLFTLQIWVKISKKVLDIIRNLSKYILDSSFSSFLLKTLANMKKFIGNFLDILRNFSKSILDSFLYLFTLANMAKVFRILPGNIKELYKPNSRLFLIPLYPVKYGNKNFPKTLWYLKKLFPINSRIFFVPFYASKYGK